MDSTLQLPAHRKLYVTFGLAYLHLTLGHCKGQGQGHEHFDCEYLENNDKRDKHYYCRRRQTPTAFRIEYKHFTLTHSKGQGQGQTFFDFECLKNGDR